MDEKTKIEEEILMVNKYTKILLTSLGFKGMQVKATRCHFFINLI